MEIYNGAARSRWGVPGDGGRGAKGEVDPARPRRAGVSRVADDAAAPRAELAAVCGRGADEAAGAGWVAGGRRIQWA